MSVENIPDHGVDHGRSAYDGDDVIAVATAATVEDLIVVHSCSTRGTVTNGSREPTVHL